MSSLFSIKLLVPKSTEPNTWNNQHTAHLARQALVPYLHPSQCAALIPQEKLLSPPETAGKSGTSSGPTWIKTQIAAPSAAQPKGLHGAKPSPARGAAEGLGDPRGSQSWLLWAYLNLSLLCCAIHSSPSLEKKWHLFNLTQLSTSLFSACLDTALNNYVKNNGIMFLCLSNQRLWIREVLFNQSSLC